MTRKRYEGTYVGRLDTNGWDGETHLVVLGTILRFSYGSRETKMLRIRLGSWIVCEITCDAFETYLKNGSIVRQK